ncbi:class I SAM-dependent methyltransferase [Amycolatopsis sp. NPDC005003]
MTADYAGASPSAIRSHYDAGNGFYRLWLGGSLVYSCALWTDDERDTLDAAQYRKLDHLSEAARATGAGRVLDVGCGWGALLDRLVEVHGVGHATGLTLSPAQAAHIAGRGDERSEARVENWVDHDPSAEYDAIISIGAFEHFADFGLGRSGRVAAYRRFFERCRHWLRRAGGRLVVQTNIKGNNVVMDRETVRDLLFMADTVFPESELPWLSEVIEASERLFDVVRVRNDGDHYARTCDAWQRALRARSAEAAELVGAKVVADYDRYLGAARSGFERGHLGLARLVFEAR